MSNGLDVLLMPGPGSSCPEDQVHPWGFSAQNKSRKVELEIKMCLFVVILDTLMM